jgi:hypothetical protein
MTTDNDQEMALAALRAASADVEANLSERFIAATYAIQRRHQFNQDQTASLHDLEKLVEDHLGQGEAK